jgi:hypothetical protein
MLNETSVFLMLSLLQQRPEQMFREAKQGGLVVPLTGYKIYITDIQ